MVFSSSTQLVYSIHTIWLPSCRSAIHSVHQQPEGTEVAYKQLTSQEFKCNPGKQMWCNIQHSTRLTPVICPNFMALQFDDSFLDNHVCIPLSLLNTLNSCMWRFNLPSLFSRFLFCSVWGVNHLSSHTSCGYHVSKYVSLSFVWRCIDETPEMTNFSHLAGILTSYRPRVIELVCCDWFSSFQFYFLHQV